MRDSTNIKRRTALKTIGAGIVGGAMTGIASSTAGAVPLGPPGTGGKRKNPITITAGHDHDNHEHWFELSETTISSGWTTIELDNQTDHVHFGAINRLQKGTLAGLGLDTDDPDVEAIGDAFVENLSQPFQDEWEPYYEGKIGWGELFDRLFGAIGWFFDPDAAPISSGGPGMLSGYRTSKTTMNFAPGYYAIECYVMDDEGVFHVSDGMVEGFEVKAEESRMSKPRATLDVSISNSDGIEFNKEYVNPGRHTFEVTFESNQAYAHGFPHDVSLIRLENGTTIDDVNDWMDYLDPDPDEGGYGDPDATYADRGALASTGNEPGPQTWLGGVQALDPTAVAETAYFEAGLGVGEYALVAEVPDPQSKGLLKTFTVAPPGWRRWDH